MKSSKLCFLPRAKILSN
jgi:hypothetical protein